MILWLRRWTFQAAQRCRRARRRTMTPAVSVSVMALDESRLIRFSHHRCAACHPASSPYMTRHDLCILYASYHPLRVQAALSLSMVCCMILFYLSLHQLFIIIPFSFRCCAHTFLITRICTYIRYPHVMQKRGIRLKRRRLSWSRVVTSFLGTR